MAVLGMAGALLLASATSAVASQSQRVWKSDGKRYTWSEVTVPYAEAGNTVLVEVPRGTEGAVLGTKRVGKNTEFVSYLPVEVREAAVAMGHHCSVRTVRVGKNTELVHYCLVNGVPMICPGMNEKGECQAKR
jgi:hypothetical protein